MSNAIVQFVEMVRERAGIDKKDEPVAHWMFCWQCNQQTDHILIASGRWEIYTCPICGNQQSYKV